MFINSLVFLLTISIALTAAGFPNLYSQVDVDGTPTEMLTLEGLIPSLPERCILPENKNDPGCVEIPVSGPNKTIWHGDGTCSYLYLICQRDKMSVVLKTPPHASETYITWMGNPEPVPSAPRPIACTTPGIHEPNTIGIFPISISKPATFTSDDVCGTNITELPNGNGQQFTNTVHLLEFLSPPGLPNKPTDVQLQLLSHTHVTVKCCETTKIEIEPCIKYCPTPPCEQIICGCTERSFTLTCSVDSVDELFECSVQLAAEETLGDDRLTYKLESCTATATSSPFDTIFIIRNNTANFLEVTYDNVGDDDLLVHHFTTPFFQFNSADPIEPEDVEINCVVNIVLK